jgi:crotonobetainyl-CoA:carnitine CoA-transferase CaiB-like acyl-CoA transferase
VFPTKDGRWISMSASMQAMVDRLYKALGVPEMLADPRFRTNADRVANAEASEAPIRAFISAHTLAEGMAFFEQNEITAAPVYDIDQFLADPHVKARRIVVDLPDKDMGTIPMHAVVPRLSASPGALRRPAPELGEHTAEVLGRLGVDGAAQQDLSRRKII